MSLQELADLLKNLVTTLAIVLSGVWAYFKYAKGRTFRERLDVHVAGTVEANGAAPLLTVSSKVANVGLSEVRLDRDGCGLRVFVCDEITPAESMAAELEWRRVGTFDVLAEHHWVEPGEALTDQIVVALPAGARAVRLQLSIVSKKNKLWSATSILSANQLQGA
jgi:hypothetical protein